MVHITHVKLKGKFTGFFFSHVGWLMVRKHKDVIEKGKTVYVKDLEEDEVVMFQKKYVT